MKLKNYFLTALCLCLFAACGSSPTKPSNAQEVTDTYPVPKDKIARDVDGVHGGKLVLSIPGKLDTFNILLSTTVETNTALGGYIFQGLTDLDPITMKTVPILAKSFEVSPDGLTYTFTLREGVLWGDGHPFTIEDVLFSFTLLYDESLPITTRDLLKNDDGSMPTITKLNDQQVQIQIKGLNVLFESAVGAVKILPKHLWEDTHKAGKFAQAMLISEDPSKIIGTGPFLLDSYVPDQRILLKRNPYYFEFDKNGKRLPYLDKVIRIVVPDLQAQVIKFQNGEIDMLEISKPEDVDLIKRDEKNSNYTVYDVGPSYNTTYLSFNQNNRSNADGKPYVEAKKLKLFSDKRFRQAMSYAIDRPGIIRTALQGLATPVYNFTSPANKIWFNPNAKTYPFDLAKAKALLDEIGLKDSNNDGRLEYEDGSPLTIAVKTNSENSTRVQIANLIRNDVAKLGIDMVLQPTPMNSVVDSINKNFEYDAVLLGWGSAIPPDPVMSKNVILSSGKSHNWNPSQATPQTEWEKQIDELLYKNQSTLDTNARIKYWHQLLDIWSEEQPQIMISALNVNLAIRNHIGNTQPIALRPYFDHNVVELYDKTLLNKK